MPRPIYWCEDCHVLADNNHVHHNVRITEGETMPRTLEAGQVIRSEGNLFLVTEYLRNRDRARALPLEQMDGIYRTNGAPILMNGSTLDASSIASDVTLTASQVARAMAATIVEQATGREQWQAQAEQAQRRISGLGVEMAEQAVADGPEAEARYNRLADRHGLPRCTRHYRVPVEMTFTGEVIVEASSPERAAEMVRVDRSREYRQHITTSFDPTRTVDTDAVREY